MSFLKNKRNHEPTWLSTMIFAISAIVLISCSDDDNGDSPSPSPNPGPIAEESETGFLYSFRLETPQGRVYYMSAHPELPSQPDPSTALELGFNNRIYINGSSVFTWSGDAGAMTKWAVDRTTFEFDAVGLLSFATAGLSGDLTSIPVFVSETQAFYTNINEGIIVEWNPSTMEIIEVLNVDPNPLIPFVPEGFTRDGELYFRNGKLFIPIDYSEILSCCEVENTDGVMVGVFDTASGTIEYLQDDRLYAGANNFLVDENNNLYVVPENGFSIRRYYDVDPDTLPNPFTFLRFADDGTFDPNFELNVGELIPSKFIQGSFVFNNKLVVTYRDTEYEWPDNFDDRFSVVAAESFSASIDLTTQEVQPFNGFEGFTFAQPWTIIDGINYFYAVRGENTEVSLLRQDSIDDYTEVSSISGGAFRRIGRLW
ncbi:MAG: hypothetical protein AAF554_18595 [Bacteroidota bacterium]